MAICKCGKEMQTGRSYGLHWLILKNGTKRKRLPNDTGVRCHDCAVKPGGYHHIGCDMAVCPMCGGQESFCDCEITHYARMKSGTVPNE